jgi:stalled ribosome alternative rescue factor ArfA
MKKDIISFKIQQPKQRAHRALFDDDLPFKHKVEKAKKGQYHRRPKHRNNLDSWEDK